MRVTKVIALILALTLMLCSLTGCIYPGYLGDDPELCSVAWANLVAIRGHWSDGEMQGGPYMDVVDTDSYGRVLFSYTERQWIKDEKGNYKESVYLVVMQKKDDTTAYYYPEDCYYHVKVEVLETDEEKYVFDTEVIEALKLLNDWEKPIDLAKCDSTEIVTKKPDGKIENGDNHQFLDDIIRRYHEHSGRYISPKNISFYDYSRFVVADDYGRELWTVYTSFEEHTEKVVTNYSYIFLVVLMPDGSCDETTVVMLKDPYNAQDAVKSIKAANNWNKPIE